MSKDVLLDCRRNISGYINPTPVQTSGTINGITGAEIFFKCENFQKTGSFKIRGATNAILNLSPEQRAAGVISHSSGNFAQAIALAASNLNIKSYIIMPHTAPVIKKLAAKHYGANIIMCEPTLQSRKETAAKIAEETGATFIHPSNSMDVIAGNSTITQELLEEHPDIDTIFVPVGGGGLIAGTALAALYFGENCRVIGGEPAEADDAYRSLISGKIETNTTTNTIADGLLTNLGDNNFPIIKENVEKIIRVTEDEIIKSMKLVFDIMKIIIEPSSAVAVAALLKSNSGFKSGKIGVILSGGNVDLDNLPFKGILENVDPSSI
jgi:threonine dehydratase